MNNSLLERYSLFTTSVNHALADLLHQEVVELKNDISRQISDSTFYKDTPKDVPEVLKYGLQASLISKFFVKPDKIVVKRLDLEEPKMIQFADKVEADLLEQKMT